jgi:hypothetical protein
MNGPNSNNKYYLTLAVLKTAVLQLGRMLTDQGGNSYCSSPYLTVAADLVS